MATTAKENKSILDTWMDAQKDLVNKWQKSTKKWQDSMQNTEHVTKSNEMFKNWMNQQSELVKNASEKVGEKKAENPFEFVNQIYKMQMDWMKGFSQANMDFSKNMAEQMRETSNKRTEDFKSQDWFQGSMMENWKNVWEAMSNSMQGFMKGQEPKNNAWNGMMNSAETYMKAFEFWMPVFKAFQNKEINPDWFQNFFQMDRYKDLMENFNKMMPGDWFKNMPQNMEDMMNQMKNNGEKGMQFYLEQVKAFSGMPLMDANPIFTQMLEWNKNLNEQMEMFSSPFIKMMTPGKQKEQVISGMEFNENYMNWTIRQSQMQFMMMATSLKSIEKFSHILIEKADKDEAINSFVDFYSLWLSTNDAEFVSLFRSPEYSKLQSDFTAFGMKLRKAMEKQMEAGMANIPVVTRSEMDDLYATVYELNKKIKGLEKELKNAKESNTNNSAASASTTKTTATKSTTSKAKSSTSTAK